MARTVCRDFQVEWRCVSPCSTNWWASCYASSQCSICLLISDIIPSELLMKVTFKELITLCHSLGQDVLSVYDSVSAEDVKMSVHAIKNTRRKMEDKHVLLPYFGALFNTVVSNCPVL